MSRAAILPQANKLPLPKPASLGDSNHHPAIIYTLTNRCLLGGLNLTADQPRTDTHAAYVGGDPYHRARPLTARLPILGPPRPVRTVHLNSRQRTNFTAGHPYSDPQVCLVSGEQATRTSHVHSGSQNFSAVSGQTTESSHSSGEAHRRIVAFGFNFTPNQKIDGNQCSFVGGGA